MANFKVQYNLPSIKNTYNPLGTIAKENIIPIVHQNTLLGIEVEVENIPKSCTKLLSDIGGWFEVEDGSLRNCGREYVSLPTRSSDVQEQLEQLFSILPKDRVFSPRTSVHVHLNMRMFNKDKLFSLVLAYLATEKLLFNWVGRNRLKNIHCVPLQDTQYTNLLANYFIGKASSIAWCKYSALNFLPIKEQKGTIEFRHMYGTDDVPTLMQWVNYILCLKTFAYFTPPDGVIKTLSALNTNSLFGNFLEKIYGDHAKSLIVSSPNWMKDIEVGVSIAKELLFTRNEIKALRGSIKPTSPIVECFALPYQDYLKDKKKITNNVNDLFPEVQ
jgi:hypothetical protein